MKNTYNPQSLLGGYFDYEWFTKEHYDAFNKIDGSLGVENGRGRALNP